MIAFPEAPRRPLLDSADVTRYLSEVTEYIGTLPAGSSDDDRSIRHHAGTQIHAQLDRIIETRDAGGLDPSIDPLLHAVVVSLISIVFELPL